MDALTRIETQLTNQAPPTLPTPPASVPALENFIDHMVTAQNNMTKTASQNAIKQAQIQEEFQAQIAFLSGQVHKAQSALAALETSTAGSPNIPVDNGLLNSRRGEVAYWRSQLQQAECPNQLNLDA